MSQFAWPFDAGPGGNITEAQWWKMALMWAPDGVLSALRGPSTAGGELAVFGDGSGLQVKVPVGTAWIKGQYYENDTQLTLGPFVAADATNPRIDRVVVRMDWGGNSAALTVLNGTPGVTPIPPTLAAAPGSVFDFPLAQVLIRAGATTVLSTDVTDERVWTDLATTLPAGMMVDWPATTAPPGWLLCYGQAVSRAQYARLFAVIGTTFGAPSGSTFSLPDCRGRVMVTLDNLGGTGASRMPSATGVGGNGGSATKTLTATELPTHHHTGNSLVATADTASANHTHQVDPSATNSSDANATHHHAGAAQTGLSTDNGTNNHSHAAGSLGGTTGNPTAAHHHTSGVSGANFVPSTGLVSASQPGSDPTGDDTPPHQHAFTVTGSTASTTDVHSHGFSVPSADTGDTSPTHQHTVDIAEFTSGFQSTNHIHTVTVSGNTGDTGSGGAFDITQPWLAVGKIIKF